MSSDQNHPRWLGFIGDDNKNPSYMAIVLLMVQKSQTTTWDVESLVNHAYQLVQDFFHQQ